MGNYFINNYNSNIERKSFISNIFPLKAWIIKMSNYYAECIFPYLAQLRKRMNYSAKLLRQLLGVQRLVVYSVC